VIVMPKFVIERNIPEAGKLSPEQLQATSRKSAEAMRNIGGIHWVQSYVTDDRVYCVYAAPDEETVRRHAEQAGLPADRVSEIRSVADASTAD
jgi:hypothetical protein